MANGGDDEGIYVDDECIISQEHFCQLFGFALIDKNHEGPDSKHASKLIRAAIKSGKWALADLCTCSPVNGQQCGLQCNNVQNKYECGENCNSTHFKCLNRSMTNNEERKMEIIPREDIGGFGMRSMEQIWTGDHIIEYKGVIITTAKSPYKGKSHYAATLLVPTTKNEDNVVVIDASDIGNAARFINHSHDPNCHAEVRRVGDQLRISIFAIKHINVGDELLWNYGRNYKLIGIDVCGCGTKLMCPDYYKFKAMQLYPNSVRPKAVKQVTEPITASLTCPPSSTNNANAASSSSSSSAPQVGIKSTKKIIKRPNGSSDEELRNASQATKSIKTTKEGRPLRKPSSSQQSNKKATTALCERPEENVRVGQPETRPKKNWAPTTAEVKKEIVEAMVKMIGGSICGVAPNQGISRPLTAPAGRPKKAKDKIVKMPKKPATATVTSQQPSTSTASTCQPPQQQPSSSPDTWKCKKCPTWIYPNPVDLADHLIKHYKESRHSLTAIKNAKKAVASAVPTPGCSKEMEPSNKTQKSTTTTKANSTAAPSGKKKCPPNKRQERKQPKDHDDDDDDGSTEGSG